MLDLKVSFTILFLMLFIKKLGSKPLLNLNKKNLIYMFIKLNKNTNFKREVKKFAERIKAENHLIYQ
jgi:hypothetical protein